MHAGDPEAEVDEGDVEGDGGRDEGAHVGVLNLWTAVGRTKGDHLHNYQTLRKFAKSFVSKDAGEISQLDRHAKKRRIGCANSPPRIEEARRWDSRNLAFAFSRMSVQSFPSHHADRFFGNFFGSS